MIRILRALLFVTLFWPASVFSFALTVNYDLEFRDYGLNAVINARFDYKGQRQRMTVMTPFQNIVEYKGDHYLMIQSLLKLLDQKIMLGTGATRIIRNDQVTEHVLFLVGELST